MIYESEKMLYFMTISNDCVNSYMLFVFTPYSTSSVQRIKNMTNEVGKLG